MGTVEERIQGELAEVDSNRRRRGEVSFQVLSGVGVGLEVDIGVEGGVWRSRWRRDDILQ